MVGMTGQDRHRPIDLLHQHDSNQLMRPSCRSEAETHISGIAQADGKSVGAPGDEACGLTAAVAPGANELSESITRDILPPAIQYDLDRIVRQRTRKRD